MMLAVDWKRAPRSPLSFGVTSIGLLAFKRNEAKCNLTFRGWSALYLFPLGFIGYGKEGVTTVYIDINLGNVKATRLRKSLSKELFSTNHKYAGELIQSGECCIE